MSGPPARRGSLDARAAAADGRSVVPVVEDDPTISEVVAGYPTRAGHSVSRAADGVAALQMARRLSPDLVVLDV